jgi:hypothetical protein
LRTIAALSSAAKGASGPSRSSKTVHEAKEFARPQNSLAKPFDGRSCRRSGIPQRFIIFGSPFSISGGRPSMLMPSGFQN